MFGYLVLAGLLAGVSGDREAVTGLIDDLFGHANSILLEEGYESYRLEDIDVRFGRGARGLGSGRFLATEGTASGLAGLKRVGGVNATASLTSLVFDFTFSYDKLSFGYKHYELQYTDDLSGGIELKLPEISGTMQITVTWTDNHCEAVLTYAKLHSLGKVVYVFTESEIPEDFRYNVLKWIMQSFQKKGDKEVETHMLDAVKQSLNEADFCSLR